MPTTIKFGKQFTKSPFKALRKHMRIASESATFLPEAMQAFFRNDREALQETRQTVSELTADADQLLKELQQRLPDATNIPLARRDLFDVLELQESIARRMQEITALLPDLPVDVPSQMRKPLKRLADRCVAATEVAYEIVKAIEKVVEAGFKGAQQDAARQLVQDVVAIGSEADALCAEITRMLLAESREMDPVAVVFLYQLVGWIDDLANFSQKLAIRSQLLLIR
jgi:predicted phosphate transport protein (TIGR00153 family)